MTTEAEKFNLSEKIMRIETQPNCTGRFILFGDVKEFIRLLKEDFSDWKESESINQKIDDRAGSKLAGDKLI